jgi:hypothetical protein
VLHIRCACYILIIQITFVCDVYAFVLFLEREPTGVCFIFRGLPVMRQCYVLYGRQGQCMFSQHQGAGLVSCINILCAVISTTGDGPARGTMG